MIWHVLAEGLKRLGFRHSEVPEAITQIEDMLLHDKEMIAVVDEGKLDYRKRLEQEIDSAVLSAWVQIKSLLEQKPLDEMKTYLNDSDTQVFSNRMEAKPATSY